MKKGKRMAVLVGCNYPNTEKALHGCHNDVISMREVLVSRFGFDPNRVELLLDKPGSLIMPTGANIKKALNSMVDGAAEGDVLLFHFWGHGTLIERPNSTMKEEAIVPCDFNLITSIDFRELVNRVPKDATFTILADSCNSGGLIDKETEQIGPSTTPADDASLMFLQHEVQPALKEDEGILISGCQTDEYSEDLKDGTQFYGAFSHAVQMVLKQNPGPLSNREIVLRARKFLAMQQLSTQHPCLYCSNKNADAIFLHKPNPRD
ncbi:hypothetical protein ACS0TY_031869 [Phlomoides rotata]